MPFYLTGPIENSPVMGTRLTQLVTVKAVNPSASSQLSLTTLGYVLNGTQTLYVSEMVLLNPGEVRTTTYFADLNAFQFTFDAPEAGGESVEVSVWGKQTSGALQAVHRIVLDELVGS